MAGLLQSLLRFVRKVGQGSGSWWQLSELQEQLLAVLVAHCCVYTYSDAVFGKQMLKLLMQTEQTQSPALRGLCQGVSW